MQPGRALGRHLVSSPRSRAIPPCRAKSTSFRSKTSHPAPNLPASHTNRVLSRSIHLEATKIVPKSPLKNPRGQAHRRRRPLREPGKSKRTTAPAPPAQPVRPQTAQSVPAPAMPYMFGPGACLPPRPPASMAASPPPCWLPVPGVHQPGMADLPAQGPWWTTPVGTGAQLTPTTGSLEDHDLQAWYVPGAGYHSY